MYVSYSDQSCLRVKRLPTSKEETDEPDFMQLQLVLLQAVSYKIFLYA